MKTYSACLLALLMLLTAFWSAPSFAEEQEGLKKPKSLWVNDSDSTDDEEAEEEEETKKKTKLKSTATSTPTSNPEEESQQEKPARDVKVSMDFKSDAQAIAQSCPGNWEAEECLKATSQSAMVLISQFGASLEHEGYKSQMDPLKEDCAASTAATQQDGIPAYALRSAYTVCANTIAEIAEATGVKPDPSYFQLMIASILCMDNNPQCRMMESSLKKWE